MKRNAVLGLFIAVALVALTLTSCKSTSPEELKAAVEIVDVGSKWLAKSYQPWPPKLILVPTITFRVKNVSARPLNYLNFNAIFKFRDDLENLGVNFLAWPSEIEGRCGKCHADQPKEWAYDTVTGWKKPVVVDH